jgi:hypothetical protein
LRQITRGLPQHLVLLLQQSVASPQLTHFAPFVASVTGLTSFFNIGLLEPVDQRMVRDPEILHDRDNVTPGSASDPFPSGHPSKSKSDLKLVCGTTVEIRPLIIPLRVRHSRLS